MESSTHRYLHEVSQDVGKPPVVSVSGADEALRVAAVVVATPWGGERGQVSVLFSEGDGVVAIPGVGDGFPHASGDSARHLGGWVCHPFFPVAPPVEGLEVHSPPGSTVRLAGYHHVVAPYFFNDTKAHVRVELVLDHVAPVDGDRQGLHYPPGNGVVLEVDFHWWAAHFWERRVGAFVEGRRGILL